MTDLKARPRLMNEEPCLLYKLLETASRATEEELEARFNRRDASKAPTEAMARIGRSNQMTEGECVCVCVCVGAKQS